EARFDRLDMKFGLLENKFGLLETRIETIETKIGIIDTKIEVIEVKMGVFETKFDSLEAKDDELSKQLVDLKDFFQEERKINNTRFSQMENSMKSFQQEVSKMNMELNAKIDLLFADMHGVSEDLYETKRRVTRLEKKLSS